MWWLGPPGPSSHPHLPPECPLRQLLSIQFENTHLALAFLFYTWRSWDSERESDLVKFSQLINGWAKTSTRQFSDEKTETRECCYLPKSSQAISSETTIKLRLAWFFPGFILLSSFYSDTSFYRNIFCHPSIPCLTICHSLNRLRTCSHTPCLLILLPSFLAPNVLLSLFMCQTPSHPTRIGTSITSFWSLLNAPHSNPIMFSMCAEPASWVCTEGNLIWLKF